MKRCFLALAVYLAGCSTPEPESQPPKPPPNQPPNPSELPSPSPALRAAVAGTERFAEHVAEELARAVSPSGSTPREDAAHVWGFASGDAAIRDWELGGMGDLSALDRALATREPLGVLGPDGSLPAHVDRDRYVLFVARDATRFGLLSRFRDPLGTKLELVEDAALVVELVSRSGEPVGGSEVRLVFDHGGRRGAESVLGGTRTDERGLAELAHAGFAVARLSSAIENDDELRIEVGSPLTTLARHVVATSSADASAVLAAEPVRIVTAPSAAILVRALPEPIGGWPRTFEFFVARSSTRSIDALEAWQRASTSVLHGPLRAEGVEFDGLNLGSELTAVVRIGGDIRMARGRVPEVAGERAELVLDLSELAPTFLGRALDEAGRPLANQELEAHRELAGNSFWDRVVSDLRTDGDGRFVLTSRQPADHSRPELDWHLRALVAGTAYEARIPASAWPARTETFVDGGDVYFAELPKLVSGRVVDDAGRAVHEARVRILARVPHDESAGLVHRIERLATTDRDGGFAFFGRTTALELGVRVERGERRSSPIACVPGSALELVLPRSGSVVGSLSVPNELRQASLLVAVRPIDERHGLRFDGSQFWRLEKHDDEPRIFDAAEPDPWRAFAADSFPRDERLESAPARALADSAALEGEATGAPCDRRFSIEDVTPGPARLVVLTANRHEVTSLDIEVRPGETLTEPRFAPLDLAPFVRTVELDVESSTGSTPGELLGLWNSGSAWSPWRRIPFDGARAKVATFEPELEIFVTAAGHRHARLVATGASAHVTLEPALDVEFVIQRRDPLVPACGELQLVDGGDLNPPVGSAAPTPFDFGSSERARVALPCAGRYLVRWFATPEPGRTRAVTTEQAYVDVSDSPRDPQQLDFPEDLIRRASRR
ncbi:MAG: carboxypeptidase-like regulatory domain-containing protein [Planctomycetes bacterium]|nr:carboxypeptidase-like regulatory domain-containing protein [Planctomycetota bacterium]